MNFKELIYSKGFNFNSLAVKSGVPVTTLRNIHERNSLMNTNLTIALKIAKALDLDIYELIEEIIEDPKELLGIYEAIELRKTTTELVKAFLEEAGRHREKRKEKKS